MSVVGFDFGNSSCVIAVAQKGGIDVIANEVSSRQTPCMAAFGEKERFLGEQAAIQHIRNIKNTITDVKRLIGRKFDEPEVQAELSQLPFKAVKLPDGGIGVEVFYAGERKVFSITAVTGMVLQKLKEITEKATQRGCTDVVIGVPGWWNDRQRRAMLDAAKIAGLNPLRLMNEITATALSWGIYKQFSETEPQYVLFYDMGQSTTSVGLVEYLKGKLRVMSTSYDRNLGGRNFDTILVDHFCKEFKEKFKIDIKTNQKALIRLTVACEKLKKMLNSNPVAPINVDSIMNDVDVKGIMQKAEMEVLFKDLIERVTAPIKKVLAEGGVPLDKISAVEISGGGTRLNFVQTTLTEFLKKDLSKTQNFEETVCKGSALQCAMLSPVFRVREFAVNDISLFPIKVSWKNAGSDPMQVEDAKDSLDVFAKNGPIPCPKRISFKKTGTVDIVAEYSDLTLLPSGSDAVVAKFQVANIPENASKISAKIKLDLNGILALEEVEMSEAVAETETPAATEPAPMQEESPKEEKKTEGQTDAAPAEKKKVVRTPLGFAESSSAIPKSELQHLIDEEARMLAADKLVFETAEKKNAVESYIYEMRDKLSSSLAEFSTEGERENIYKLFEQVQDWLYGEGENQTKSVYVKKLDEMKVLGDPIVRRKVEFECRADAINNLRATAQQFKNSASSADPKYEHISAEERAKVVADADSALKWLQEKTSAQDKLPKHANPAVMVAEITKKQDELTKACNVIMNKPKPKPEPKKEEPKKEEPKKEEAKAEEPKKEEAAKPEEAKKTDMDLD